jgi:hypothetical protein
MSTPYLILTADDGTVYNLPDTLWFKNGAKIKPNTSVQNLLYAVGGKQTADGFPQANDLVIEGLVYDSSASGTIETTLRGLFLAISRGGVLSISGDSPARGIDVRNAQIETEWVHWPTFVQVHIDFTCEFPFFEDTSYTTVSQVFAGNGSLIVTVSNCDYVINPIIDIAADRGVDVPGVQIKNLNDGGYPCNFNCPFLTAGSTARIDCRQGLVTVNGTNQINYFNPAIFPRLQPGSNELAYEGASMTMTVSYKRVYVF